ncbi:MAG: sialidase family protein [Planctomycetota bacterium]|nr:sialidase family protein [Planctomycetota bacterium]
MRRLAVGCFVLCVSQVLAEPAVLRREFIYESAPFPQCHASSIVETPGGLIATWFGGTREKHPDVCIWIARHREGEWTAPQKVIDGVQSDGTRHPCWNPVLFCGPDGQLLLFAKVGPSPRTWWGVLRRSTDGGQTWGPLERLPDGIAGPIKNKPVLLADGRLLCGSSTEDRGWRVHLEWTRDFGKTWERTDALNDGQKLHAIQPAILRLATGELQILCRGRRGAIEQAFERDGRWTKLQKSSLPNNNSGLDAVTLRDGRQLLVYNHTTRGRTPLNVAVSEDGQHWEAAMRLETEPGEYSYPAVIQTADGRVHITYTWRRRRVRHVVLDPQQLQLRPIVEGRWPE